MKRSLQPEEARLWSIVTATVRPAHGRGAARAPAAEALPVVPVETANPPPRFSARPKPKGPPPRAPTPTAPQPTGPGHIEPNRKRRIARERDALDRRIDLHGLGQDAARAALFGFLMRAQAEGVRAVLVITGKGLQGDGVLRRRAPEWLADPGLRGVVAGVSIAERHHGGEGALYVALKRRP
jgi:DNA-nicking Smr family endonuclease